MSTGKAVARLRRLIKRFVKDGVTDPRKFSEWKKNPKNARYMAKCLDYSQGKGMPAATNLVKPAFHPTLPLISLNYTQVAHVSLHKFDDGWTAPIRLCRGIVFDHKGVVVAFAFPKFFNYGEHPETRNLPDGPFEATFKQDGHLGIIFEYEGELYITTRGSFTSNTAKIATVMLDKKREEWRHKFPKNKTPLVEIIHPATHVHVDYGDREDFEVIGAYNRRSYRDYNYKNLKRLAKLLNLPITPVWEGSSIDELIQWTRDLNLHNIEGVVARFSDRRVKFKLKTYIAMMIKDKLQPRWIMTRMKEGSLTQRTADLPGEVQLEIEQLVAQVRAAATASADKKECWERLYELEPDVEKRTPYYKQMCRKFYSWVQAGEPAAAAEDDSQESAA